MSGRAASRPRRARALLPDPTHWRHSRDFRLIWLAGVVTNFGSFLTFVALPVQLKDLTGSAAAVGAVGAVTDARVPVWSGGLACTAAVGLLAAGLPALLAYTAADPAGPSARPGAPGPAERAGTA